MSELSTFLFIWNDFEPEQNMCVNLRDLDLQETELLGERNKGQYSPPEGLVEKIMSSIS